MTPFAPRPVAPDPFPHVVADDWLDGGLFRAAAAAFPECGPGSGPTGFTCFRGDPGFDALISAEPAWRELHGMFASQAFTDYLLAQFADVFAQECVHDLSGARFVDYVEDRVDKERPSIRAPMHAASELWVRFDIMQGRLGYARGPHLDHRRRLATLLLYFSDPAETGTKGGDLALHDSALQPVKTVQPRANRAVMFPCNNASWHSVSPILEQRSPRNFVQVTLSSSTDMWAPLPGKEAGTWRRHLKRFLGRS